MSSIYSNHWGSTLNKAAAAMAEGELSSLLTANGVWLMEMFIC
jgi:hypothetical protein